MDMGSVPGSTTANEARTDVDQEPEANQAPNSEEREEAPEGADSREEAEQPVR